MHHPTDRIAHTTAFVTPVVEHWLEREIAQWVDPTTHRTMSERFYHGATSRSQKSYRIIDVHSSSILGLYLMGGQVRSGQSV